MSVMVTGGAGFIGAHVASSLADTGQEVVSVDASRSYYSLALKSARCRALGSPASQFDLATLGEIEAGTLGLSEVTAIIHLAAQPGVRLPTWQYGDYERDNLVSLANSLRLARSLPRRPVLLFASSSSVYGSAVPPFREAETILAPTSYYGETKVLGEAMVRAFADQTEIPAIAMRFFTAYGPWGRPDMAYFRLAAAAATGGSFTLFGDGSVRRDFTYIDDIVTSVVGLLGHLRTVRGKYFEAVNIGGGRPVSMTEIVEKMSRISGNQLDVAMTAPDSRDAPITEADFSRLQALTGAFPQISLDEGLQRVWDWSTRDDVTPHLSDWVRSTMEPEPDPSSG